MKCSECHGKGTTILDVPGWGVRAEVNCPACQGSGQTGDPEACPKCNGSKHMVVNMGFLVEVDCDECNGTGTK
jgi:DnaJ-class molecular chaperone